MPSVRAFALALFSAAFGLGVEQAFSCALEPDKLRTHLDLRSPKIAQVVRTRRQVDNSDRIFEQTVKLTSGRTVTFAIYGCNHFGYRFLFRPLPGVTRSTPLSDLVRIARDQFSSVPLRKVDAVWLGDTAQSLSDEAIAESTKMGEGSYSISVGDASYTVSVPEPGVLEIEYDFAL